MVSPCPSVSSPCLSMWFVSVCFHLFFSLVSLRPEGVHASLPLDDSAGQLGMAASSKNLRFSHG